MAQEMAVEDVQTEPDERATGSNDLQIRRGRVDSLVLYEITDDELTLLEKGSPSSTFLSCSIFLLTMGISFLTSLLASTNLNDRTFLFFLVLAVLGLLLGGVLFVYWFRSGREGVEVCKKIRKRLKVPSR